MGALEAQGAHALYKPTQGWSLGFLAAWCEADLAVVPRQSDHLRYAPTRAQRRAARDRLKAHPLGRLLRSLERPRREGTDSEPELCPSGL